MSDEVRPWDLLNPKEPRSLEEQVGARLSICRGCEFFRAKTEQCRKCGCFMKLKTKLERAHCPIGKW